MCLSIVLGGGGIVFFWGGGSSLVQTVMDVEDDTMNHCCYYGTVKTNTSTHLWGNSQFVSDPLWCSGEEKKNSSRYCFPTVCNQRPPPTPPPAKTTISSDVQYKPQTLPSKHPSVASLGKRGDYKEWSNLQKLYLPPQPPTLPTPKLPLLPFIPPPTSVWTQESSKLVLNHLQPQGHVHKSTSSASLLSTLMPVTMLGRGRDSVCVCVCVWECECACACVLDEKASNQNEMSLFFFLFSFLPRRPFFFPFGPNLHWYQSMKQRPCETVGPS